MSGPHKSAAKRQDAGDGPHFTSQLPTGVRIRRPCSQLIRNKTSPVRTNLHSIGFRTDGVGTCAGFLTRCAPQPPIQMNVGGVLEPSQSQKLNFSVHRIARRFQVHPGLLSVGKKAHPNLVLNGPHRSRTNDTRSSWDLLRGGQWNILGIPKSSPPSDDTPGRLWTDPVLRWRRSQPYRYST